MHPFHEELQSNLLAIVIYDILMDREKHLRRRKRDGLMIPSV